MTPPELLSLRPEDLDHHHLCCALGDKKHAAGVEAKKAWLRARMAEGLRFVKLDVRGKVFIEYAPAEVAWRPVVAPGFLVIHCLWVSGRFAKQGHAGRLLEHCLGEAREEGRAGVVVAVGARKRPFLGDRRFFLHHGFEEVDRAGEFRLLALRLDPGAPQPRFAAAVSSPGADLAGGFRLRWDDQCPFNRHWAPRVAGWLRARGHEVTVEQITTAAQAQAVASPLGTYGLEAPGRLACHHLTTETSTGRMLLKR